MDLTSATFAYPDLDGTERACVARSLGHAEPEPGFFVLSTCLRVEFVAPCDEPTLREKVSELTDQFPGVRFRTGREAAEHVFRVAAGLESPVVGEAEVLSQFRQAVARIKDRGGADGAFLRLLESAIAAGRSSRELMGTSPHDTMAAIAAQVVGGASEVAVIGSGMMARAVLAALSSLPAPPQVTVVARSPEKAGPGAHRVRTLDHLGDVLSGSPAVISATAASTRLLDRAVLADVLTRRSSPLTLVDMAMPPDFDAPDTGAVDYVGIDDIARLAARRGEADEASAQVAVAAGEAHHRYVNQGQAGPVIRSIMASADAAVAETVSRFSGKLSDPADHAVLQQAVHTVARRLVDRPVAAVRSGRDPRLVELLSTVFEDD